MLYLELYSSPIRLILSLLVVPNTLQNFLKSTLLMNLYPRKDYYQTYMAEQLKIFTPILGSTQFPIQRVPGSFPGGKEEES